MEVRIPLKTDTANSYPSANLVIESSDDSDRVSLHINDDDRKVSILRSDLIKVLKILI